MSTLLAAVSVTDEPDWMVTPLIVSGPWLFSVTVLFEMIEFVQLMPASPVALEMLTGPVERIRVVGWHGPVTFRVGAGDWSADGSCWRPRLRLPLPRLRLAEPSGSPSGPGCWSPRHLAQRPSWLLVARALVYACSATLYAAAKAVSVSVSACNWALRLVLQRPEPWLKYLRRCSTVFDAAIRAGRLRRYAATSAIPSVKPAMAEAKLNWAASVKVKWCSTTWNVDDQ